jgi:hypothetical protein
MCSLDKAIKFKKEYRKHYRKAAAVDHQCRCHGGCPYCKGNKIRFDRYHRRIADEKLNEWRKLDE